MINIRESKDTELHILTGLIDDEIKYEVYLGDNLVGLYYSWEELSARMDNDVEDVLVSIAEELEKEREI